MAARCALHADVEPVAACNRCGGFMCEACVSPPVPGLDLATYGLLCRACAARLGPPPSSRARWAFGLSLAALGGSLFFPCVPVLNVVLWPAALVAGPAALALSVAELAAIRRGEASPRGERAARAARRLAITHLVLVAVVGAVLLALRGIDLLHVD